MGLSVSLLERLDSCLTRDGCQPCESHGTQKDGCREATLHAFLTFVYDRFVEHDIART